jgi:two-component system LytT family sensor kinase
MESLGRKAVWPSIRNPLLVVAVIHILIILRSAQSEGVSLTSLLTRQPGQWLRWLAWSLVAPGIGLLARYVATRRLKWSHAVGLFIASGVLSLLGYYILEELFKMLFLGRPFFESFAETRKNLLWSWDLPIFGLILSINLALEYYQHNRQKEVLASRLEKELAVNTLATLKAQIQPHFLFNTLHVISALVKSDPEAAEKTIARLSDLLRASMKGVEAPEVALTDELDILMNYVEIVRLRFKGRLAFDLDVRPDAAAALVPGFVLQPLVENAVRHGISHKIEGGTVRIGAFRQGQSLVVRVSDTGPGFSGDRDDILERGSGLSNLQKRLELLYPGKFRLEVLRDEGGGALAVLEIPFRVKRQGLWREEQDREGPRLDHR